MKFSRREITDLLKAWIVVSIIFSIAFGAKSLNIESLRLFGISAITVGIGFLLHELAHKFVAQKFRCWAEFRSFDQMLGIALLLSFFGFIFIAPGAVMIKGKVDKRKNGLISIAGPVTNIILGIFFITLSFLFSNKLLKNIADYGAEINLLLAIFISESWDLLQAPYWLFNWRFFPFSAFYNFQHQQNYLKSQDLFHYLLKFQQHYMLLYLYKKHIMLLKF